MDASHCYHDYVCAPIITMHCCSDFQMILNILSEYSENSRRNKSINQTKFGSWANGRTQHRIELNEERLTAEQVAYRSPPITPKRKTYGFC